MAETPKLSVEEALKKLRGADTPKSKKAQHRCDAQLPARELPALAAAAGLCP